MSNWVCFGLIRFVLDRLVLLRLVVLFDVGGFVSVGLDFSVELVLFRLDWSCYGWIGVVSVGLVLFRLIGFISVVLVLFRLDYSFLLDYLFRLDRSFRLVLKHAVKF